MKYITPRERKTIEKIHYLRQIKEDNDYKEDVYHQLLLKIRDRMPLQTKLYDIDVIDPSEKNKLCEYIRRKQPVVIKGLAQNTEAVRRWNVSTFIKKYGHFTPYVHQ
jgi:Tfp pilus assembly protein PilN